MTMQYQLIVVGPPAQIEEFASQMEFNSIWSSISKWSYLLGSPSGCLTGVAGSLSNAPFLPEWSTDFTERFPDFTLFLFRKEKPTLQVINTGLIMEMRVSDPVRYINSKLLWRVDSMTKNLGELREFFYPVGMVTQREFAHTRILLALLRTIEEPVVAQYVEAHEKDFLDKVVELSFKDLKD